MEAYMRLAQKLFSSFNSAYIERFSRTSNSYADALATLASAMESEMKRIIEVEFLSRPSIDAEKGCHTVFNVEADLGVSWMDPIIYHLKNRTLPDEINESYRIRAQASRYCLSLDQKLYRRSFSGAYLRCVHPKKIQKIIFELHEGSCGSQTSGGSLALRARN